jgi:hypothetical protein
MLSQQVPNVEKPKRAKKDQKYTVKVELTISNDGAAVTVSFKLEVVKKKLGRPVGSKNKSTLDGRKKEPEPKATVYEVHPAISLG